MIDDLKRKLDRLAHEYAFMDWDEVETRPSVETDLLNILVARGLCFHQALAQADPIAYARDYGATMSDCLDRLRDGDPANYDRVITMYNNFNPWQREHFVEQFMRDHNNKETE